MATFTRVQASTPASASGGATADSSFASPVTAGNMIVVEVLGAVNTIGPTFAVSDNQGNTYIEVVDGGNRVGQGSAIWYAYNVVASGTFTVHASTQDAVWVTAQEVHGFGAALPDIVTSHQIGGGAPSTGNTPSTNANDAFIATACGNANLGGLTIESVSPAWTVEANFGGFAGQTATRIVSVQGVQSCSWSGFVGYSACIAAFSVVTEYTPPQVTQVVESLVVQGENPSQDVTQIVESLIVSGALKHNLTQVVQTIIVLNPTPPTPIVLPTPTNTSAWKLLRFDLKRREEEEA